MLGGDGGRGWRNGQGRGLQIVLIFVVVLIIIIVLILVIWFYSGRNGPGAIEDVKALFFARSSGAQS